MNGTKDKSININKWKYVWKSKWVDGWMRGWINTRKCEQNMMEGGKNGRKGI